MDNHKKTLKVYTPYQERIRKCFAEAYRFIDKNKCARTESDWKRIAGSLDEYSDPLTVDLVAACFTELEREYKAHRDGGEYL